MGDGELVGEPLRDRFAADYDVVDIDGVRVEFPDGWGLVRASNTTAALTARFEASSPEELETIMQEFRAQIGLVEPNLNLPF